MRRTAWQLLRLNTPHPTGTHTTHSIPCPAPHSSLPPFAALLMLALRLLHAMAGTAACAWGAAAHGGTVFLLTLLLPAYTVPEEQRAAFEAACVAAASLLSRLAAHPLHGARVTLLLRSVHVSVLCGCGCMWVKVWVVGGYGCRNTVHCTCCRCKCHPLFLATPPSHAFSLMQQAAAAGASGRGARRARRGGSCGAGPGKLAGVGAPLLLRCCCASCACILQSAEQQPTHALL